MSTDEIIYNQALSDGMPAPLASLIVAQARHETGGYTSNVFLTCGNCFGYKWAGQSYADGPCMQSPELDSYAKYDGGPAQSTHEITQWIRRRQAEGKFPADLNTITTPDVYASLLKNSGYYGDTLTNYTNGLIYWLGKLPDTVKATGAGVLLILLALGILAYRKKLFRL